MPARKTLAKRPTKAAYIEIGYMGILLDATKALKVIELLGDAVTCGRSFEGRSYRYRVESQLELNMTMVKPDQVEFPEQMSSRLALENKPTPDFFDQ